jgi:hypothetical protein
MATAKAQDASSNSGASTNPNTATTGDNAWLVTPETAAVPVAEPLDFSASDTWGQGGRFVVNEQGLRVPAPTI